MFTVGYETCTVVEVRERRRARMVDHKKSESLAPRKRKIGEGTTAIASRTVFGRPVKERERYPGCCYNYQSCAVRQCRRKEGRREG